MRYLVVPLVLAVETKRANCMQKDCDCNPEDESGIHRVVVLPSEDCRDERDSETDHRRYDDSDLETNQTVSAGTDQRELHPPHEPMFTRIGQSEDGEKAHNGVTPTVPVRPIQLARTV